MPAAEIDAFSLSGNIQLYLLNDYECTIFCILLPLRMLTKERALLHG